MSSSLSSNSSVKSLVQLTWAVVDMHGTQNTIVVTVSVLCALEENPFLHSLSNIIIAPP